MKNDEEASIGYKFLQQIVGTFFLFVSFTVETQAQIGKERERERFQFLIPLYFSVIRYIVENGSATSQNGIALLRFKPIRDGTQPKLHDGKIFPRLLH